MAEFIHLDAAAKLVGKSEVTIRRLVKAGKVTAKKEKTHTGFIYLVDPEEVRGYYGMRGSLKLGSDPAPRAEVEPDPEPEEPTKHAVATQGRVRVAISGVQGDPVEYWVKRAETYEERYHHEVQNTAHLREELGLWRGRAEHAQALLMKLLPGPGTAQIGERRNAPEQATMTVRRLTFAGMMVLIALPTVLIVGAGLVYFLVIKK